MSDRSASPEVQEGWEDSFVETPVNEDGPDNESLIPKPKRPLSAYNLFFRDQREMLLKVLPCRAGMSQEHGKHGKITFQELAKTIGAKWKQVPALEKQRYEDIASVGRNEYNKIVKEWKEQQKRLGKPTLIKQRRKRVRKTRKMPAGSVAKTPSSTLVMEDLHVNNSMALTQIKRGMLQVPSASDFQYGEFHQDDHQDYTLPQRESFDNVGLASTGEPVSLFDVEQPSSASIEHQTVMEAPLFSPTNYSSMAIRVDYFDPMQSGDTIEPAPITPLDAFDPLPSGRDFLPGDESAEPLPIDFPMIQSTSTTGSKKFDLLASRLGPDCVNLFVGMFKN